MRSQYLSSFARLLPHRDIAIDLGTANTRLLVPSAGLVLDVPTAIEITSGDHYPHLLSPALNKDCGKSRTVMPVCDGVIRNGTVATLLLKKLLKRTCRFGWSLPRVLVGAPSHASEADRQALVQSLQQAGASTVAVVSEPLAAAIGAGLDVSSPYSQMVVDIGDGMTDVAVIREGNVIRTAVVPIAGKDIRESVQTMLKTRYGIEICRTDADTLTHALGNIDVLADDRKLSCDIGDPSGKERIAVSTHEVREAVRPVLRTIAEAIAEIVPGLPPKVGAEIIETGICFTGGVAKHSGFAELIGERTGLNVQSAPSPLYSVIYGIARMLKTTCETNFWQPRASYSPDFV